MSKYIIIESQESQNAAKICYPAATKEDAARIINSLVDEGYCQAEDLQIHVVTESYRLSNDLDLISA